MPRINDTRPFFGFGEFIDMSVVSTDVEKDIQFPSNADLLVQHIDVSLFDEDGGLSESLQTRNEITLQIADRNSGETFFNQAMDIFLLRRYTTSTAFQPFVIPRSTQYRLTARITSFVNAGVPIGDLPVRLWVAFIGRKITG